MNRDMISISKFKSVQKEIIQALSKEYQDFILNCFRTLNTPEIQRSLSLFLMKKKLNLQNLPLADFLVYFGMRKRLPAKSPAASF